MKNIHARQITINKIFMQKPDLKNSYEGSVLVKHSCGSKIPHLPHNFS